MITTGRGSLKGHNYISLETYRKNGEAVRTPVWFAQEEDKIFVWTFGGSGKAKRIRRCAQVKIAPANIRGKPLGQYIEGEAQIHPLLSDSYQYGNHLIIRKYGLWKRIFEFVNRRSAASQIIVEIKLKE